MELKKRQVFNGKLQASMVYVRKIVNVVNSTRLRKERSSSYTKLSGNVECPWHESIIDNTSDGVITCLVFADDVCNGFGAESFEVLEVVMDGARWVEAVIVVAVGDGGYGDWTRWVWFDGVEDESGESESGFETFRDESFTELTDWCDVSLSWIWNC